MDYDADGILDFISGSYDPGDIYLIRGLGKGEFAAAESIKDKAGLALVHHPVEFAKFVALKEPEDSNSNESIQLRVASFGSWPATVDWDNDGDLDMLIGTFGGELFLRRNEGTRAKPEYAEASERVLVGEKPMKVNLHFCPSVADWNGDGKWDIVVGAADGSVGWFPNAGEPHQPKFEPYQLLVPAKSDGKFMEQTLKDGESPKPAVRTQVSVVDFDLDGRLDLLVGDYLDVKVTRELTDAESMELMALNAEIDEALAKLTAIPYPTERDEESLKKFAEAREPFSKIYQAAEKKREGFFKEDRRAGNVWLYLRAKSAAKPVGLKATESALEAAKPDSNASATDTEGSSGPVEISARLEEMTLLVELEVRDGWHVYAQSPPGKGDSAVSIRFSLPNGVELDGDLSKPVGEPKLDDPLVEIYRGKVSFRQKLKGSIPKSAKLEVIVNYQTCNEELCLPPTTFKQNVLE